VPASITPGSVTRDEAVEAFAREGCSEPRAWGNGPGDIYGRHDHPRAKVLFCVEGSIVFHTDGGDMALEAGDRLDLPAGAGHAASVGPMGCACVEAWGP
jgi:mannose-6-phosphate isomerase-like protein (cupin superfamily)